MRSGTGLPWLWRLDQAKLVPGPTATLAPHPARQGWSADPTGADHD